MIVPRSTSAQRVLPTEVLTRSGARLMDGRRYGQSMLLAANRTTQHVRVPVVVPAGRHMLRLVCGLSHGADKDASSRLSIRISNMDGTKVQTVLPEQQIHRGIGSTALFVALLELPVAERRRVNLLKIQWQGGSPIHLVRLEVDRQ